RGRSEAEAVHPAVERARPLQTTDLDRPDVARAREDLRGGEGFFGVFRVVVDRAIGHLDLVWDVEGGFRRDRTLLERARDRHRLERGAGFVVEADRAILERPRRRGARIVGVDLWPVG